MGIKQILQIFSFLVILLLGTSGVMAANFSVTTDPLEDTKVSSSQDVNTEFTVENTGSDSLNVTIESATLQDGSNSLTIPSSSISDITSGNSKTVSLTYDTPSSPGNYSGTLNVVNEQNSSENVSVSATIEIKTRDILKFRNEDDDFTVNFRGDINDDIDDEDFRIENTGSIDITNMEVEVDGDFDGINSGEELPENDVEIEFDDNDDKDRLESGDDLRLVANIDLDDDDLEIDTYEGSFTLTSDQGQFSFDVEVEVEGGDEEVEIQYPRSRIELRGEEGERLSDLEFDVDNTGDIDLSDMRLQMEEDLRDGANSIPVSAVSFSPDEFDLEDGESEEIELRIEIPDDQAPGTYTGTIELVDSQGDSLDEIDLEVRVVGDVFLSDITGINTADSDTSYNPGDTVNIGFEVNNEGSTEFRNVRVEGILFDADATNSDITETTNSFFLDSGDSVERTLRFDLPEDAQDGTITLELRLSYGDQSTTEIETITVERPETEISIESYGINPSIATCDSTLFTFMRLQNLGRFDEDVKVTTSIEDTNIQQESGLFEMDVDESSQENMNLNIENLDSGSYTVVQRVSYGNGLFKKRESSLTIRECGDTTGVDIDPINETNTSGNQTGSGNGDSDDSVTLFGQEMSETTAYLASGLAAVILLIIVSLFFV